METDLKMARQVQEAFINRIHPVFPRDSSAEKSALRFAHRYLPTTSLGGDFFDFLQLSDTKCGVLVCDVMGHGVRAGLLTALIRGVVEEMGARAADPLNVLREVNHSLMPIVERTGQPVFATVFFGVIDTSDRTLVYGNAGHPAPFIRHAQSDALSRLAPADPEPAAGLIANFEYTSHSSAFQPGDLFVGYTDGILEASNQTGVMFGEERLRETLNKNRRLSVSEFSDRLLSEVTTHSGRSLFEDDVCIVAIEAR
jgi:sigma-B regulation protein RsbU (phosphoserine phosphatase)